MGGRGQAMAQGTGVLALFPLPGGLRDAPWELTLTSQVTQHSPAPWASVTCLSTRVPPAGLRLLQGRALIYFTLASPGSGPRPANGWSLAGALLSLVALPWQKRPHLSIGAKVILWLPTRALAGRVLCTQCGHGSSGLWLP